MNAGLRKRILIVFVLALPFLVALGFLILQNRPASLAETPLPNPNGYDKFVTAGKMLQDDPGLYDSMSEVELSSLVATNAEALALVRAGLTNECRVPVQFSVSYSSSSIKDIMAFRSLAQTFAAEGRLAELNNRLGDAAKSYLDMIHFGNEATRGGRLVEGMIGTAIESMGTGGLQKFAGRLDAKSCREAAASLEILDSQRQSWEEILNQEKNWTRKVFGLRGQVYQLFYSRALKEMRGDARAEKTFKEHQQETRHLIVDLAARSYELEKGKPLTNIVDLVPAYLKTIPQDPVTGKAMIYSPR
jgi:hypothetical protein